jgi:hypothetical protein
MEDSAQGVRVVRITPFMLDVIEECPDKPWDKFLGTFSRRRDAERFAQKVRAERQLSRSSGPG